MTHRIVDLPKNSMVIFHVSLPEGISAGEILSIKTKEQPEICL